MSKVRTCASLGWVVWYKGSLCFEDNDDRFYQQRWLVRSFGELGQGQRERGSGGQLDRVLFLEADEGQKELRGMCR